MNVELKLRYCTDAYGHTKYVNGKQFPLWNIFPKGVSNHEQFIENFCDEKLYVNDADNGGEETIYFRFSDGVCYKVEHSWWWDFIDTDDDYDYGSSTLRNEFLLDKVDIDVLPIHMKVDDRDWLVY